MKIEILALILGDLRLGLARIVGGLSLLIGAALPGPAALGQAAFVENFDNNGINSPGEPGPPNLLAQGWVFRDQSSPPVEYGQPFKDGNLAWLTPYNGAGYLGATYSMAVPQQATMNQWAILPPVPNQRASDPVSLWLRRVDNGLVPTC